MRITNKLFFIFITLCLNTFIFTPLLVESQPEIKDKVNVTADGFKGIVRGKVTNKSGGITPVPDQEVKLTIHSAEAASSQMESQAGVKDKTATVVSVVARSDKDGNFIFSDLDVGQEISYMITTEFKGIRYFGGIIQFKETQFEVNTELTVYETTTKEPELQVKREHFIANMAEDGIYVTNVLIIENKGDKTFIAASNEGSEKTGTYRISLPKGYDQVQYFRGLSQESAVESESGIVFSDAIHPGIMQLVYGYRLPGKLGGGYQLTKIFDYDTLSIDVLFLDSGIRIQSDRLQEGGSVQLNDRNYLRLTGNNIRRGEKAKISIAIEKPMVSQSSIKWAVIGIVIVITVAAFSYVFLKRQDKTQEGSTIVTSPEAKKARFTDLEMERKELIKSIAHLDDQLADQLISQKDYQESREKKKERLVEITKLLGKI